MIYLDNSATTKVDQDVAEIAVRMMTREFANPSSPYLLGRDALQFITQARYHIAKVISAPTRRIFFTSGGTESNNLAIQGSVKNQKKFGNKIITTAIEHSSVRETCEHLAKEGYEVSFVKPRNGRIQAEDVIHQVDANTILVSVMAVNNETGEILPVKEIVKGVREKNPNTIIHCDCVQGFCKIPFKITEIDVDLLSMSAHKIHAPKGCGALYIKEGLEICPLQYGGAQESKIRPGTENTSSIAAFGFAADKALKSLQENGEKVTTLRDHLLCRLKETEGIEINSPVGGSPYLLNISTLPVQTDTMIHELRMREIYVSGSAACTKGAKSRVIEAMGLGDKRRDTTLRISFSKENNVEEIDCLADAINEIITTTVKEK
ncbi:MAG: cysteine desulfurase family protein [Lachnospiraceae bacterium]